MTNPELGSNIHIHEGYYRKLGNSLEFKKLLHEHPGVLRSTLDLTRRADEVYNPRDIQLGTTIVSWSKERNQFELIRMGDLDLSATRARRPYFAYFPSRGVLFAHGDSFKDEARNLEVTVLGKSNRIWGRNDDIIPPARRDNSTYFKIKLGNDVFFVKKSTATNNPGYWEFTNTSKTSQVLQSVSNLEVVEAQLGYEDYDQSWFVSKWKDLESSGFLPTMLLHSYNRDDYGKHLYEDDPTLEEMCRREAERTERDKKIDSKITEIQSKMSEVGMQLRDLKTNLFYNPETDKFFLLDITTEIAPEGIQQGFIEP